MPAREKCIGACFFSGSMIYLIMTVTSIDTPKIIDTKTLYLDTILICKSINTTPTILGSFLCLWYRKWYQVLNIFLSFGIKLEILVS